jgi:hypothetical protein
VQELRLTLSLQNPPAKSAIVKGYQTPARDLAARRARKPLTFRAYARHHPRIGILGGEQLVHDAQPRAALAPSLSRNLR